jgi:hypothetical protein
MIGRSAQRRKTMDSERIPISVFNATKDITATLNALLQTLHCINMTIPAARNPHKGWRVSVCSATSSIRRKSLRDLSMKPVEAASRYGGRGMTMSGWRFVSIFAWYVLLSAVAALFAAAPYWIWPA